MVPLIVLKLFDAIKWAHEIAGTDNQVVSRVKEDAKKTIGFSRDMADGTGLQLRMVTSKTFLHDFQSRSLWSFSSFSLLIKRYTFSSRS